MKTEHRFEPVSITLKGSPVGKDPIGQDLILWDFHITGAQADLYSTMVEVMERNPVFQASVRAAISYIDNHDKESCPYCNPKIN